MRCLSLTGIVRRGSAFRSNLELRVISGTVDVPSSLNSLLCSPSIIVPPMSKEINQTCVVYRFYGSQAPAALALHEKHYGMTRRVISNNRPISNHNRVADRVMTCILTGSNVPQEIDQLSAREAAHFVRQLTPEPIGADVYAIACTKLITEAQVAETTEETLSLLKEATGLVFQMPSRFRATAVELTALRCIEQCKSSPMKSNRSVPEILEMCHEWVKTMRVVDQGGVLRAHLAIAQYIRENSVNDSDSVLTGLVNSQHKEHEIVSSTIEYVMTTCRSKRSLAGEVLQPMAKILSTDHSKWVLGVELLDLAQSSGVYFNLNHVDELLWLLIRAGQHGRVLGLWNWLKLTTCAGSRNVISAVILALTKEKKNINDAFHLTQHLSQKGLVPTVQAQIAVLTVISEQDSPLCDYAAQLVYFWAPMKSAADQMVYPGTITATEAVQNAYRLYYLLFVSFAKARKTEQAAEVLQSFITGVSAKEEVTDMKDVEVYNNLSMTLMREFKDDELSSVSRLLHGAVIRNKKAITTEVVEKVVISLCRLGERFLECSSSDNINMRLKHAGFALGLLSCSSSLLKFTNELTMSSSYTSETVYEGVDRLLRGAIESLKSIISSGTMDVNDVHSIAIRLMFSCLRSECWGEAKNTVKVVSEELHVEMPDDVQKWFSFMSVDEGDDASSILEELGRD